MLCASIRESTQYSTVQLRLSHTWICNLKHREKLCDFQPNVYMYVRMSSMRKFSNSNFVSTLAMVTFDKGSQRRKSQVLDTMCGHEGVLYNVVQLYHTIEPHT